MSVIPLKHPAVVRTTGALGEQIVTLPQSEVQHHLGAYVIAATNHETFGDPIPEHLEQPVAQDQTTSDQAVS